MTVPANIPAGMGATSSFPKVIGTATSFESGSLETTHNVAMPATVNAGDLLIAILGFNDAPGTVTFPNFTKLFETSGSPSNRVLVIGYKQADGTEGGGTEDVTTVNQENSAHAVYRIRGHKPPAVQAPEVSAGADSVGDPNPDNLTPTGGPKKFLWIACAQGSSGSETITGAPSGYENELLADVTAVAVGMGTKEAEASSENPGAFTVSSAVQWGAATVAVHPA